MPKNAAPFLAAKLFVIDAHAHIVPQNFPALPAGVPAGEWPAMIPLDDGRAQMLTGGKEFRIFEPAYWDVPGRLNTLDTENVDFQILSPLPELLGYWLDVRTTAAMAEHINHTIMNAVASAPARLAGLGMLPLQDIALSVETARGIASLGMCGVLVASNVNGTSIADKSFYPVFAELEALELAVFVHGYRPAGTERLLGSPLLGPIIGVPQDTAAAVASFMMTDIFGKFPRIKLGFAHGGGSFGAVLDRMDHVWHEFPEMRQSLKTPPREYIKKFFFDTITFSDAYLRYLVEVLGADVLMAGSDGPTPIGQKGLETFIVKACQGNIGLSEKILHRNAINFFGLQHIFTN